MNKERLDRILSAGPIKPAKREKILGTEVFVADGFVPPSMVRFLYRFNMHVTSEEYPFGCFATIWFIEEESGLATGICIFEAFHDPGNSSEAKAEMRIKQSLSKAKAHIRRRKMH